MRSSRKFKCLLCGWEGTEPQNIEYIEFGSDSSDWFLVCPVCSEEHDIPTQTLVMYLDVII